MIVLLFSLMAAASTPSLRACVDALSVHRAATGQPVQPTMQYRRASESELTNRCDERGDLNAIRKALRYQVSRCQTLDPNDKTSMRLGCRVFARNEWCTQTNTRMLEIANSSPNTATFMNRIRAEFDWYKSLGLPAPEKTFSRGDVQFTGYYSPLLKASRTRQGRFQYPLYSVPPELVQIPDSSPLNCGTSIRGTPIKWCRFANGKYTPFFTRTEIENGALKGRGLEIAYVEDSVDLNFVMIQGSATLELPGKQFIHANFGAKNGRTLRMLGGIVRCAGGSRADGATAQNIKRFLSAHPAQARELMDVDDSYVFFREANDGPLGSEKVPVTALHSIAVDRSLVPPGSSTLIDVRKFSGGTCPSVSTFALAQDTGGAIRGAHVDWYFGAGDHAGEVAGKMNNAGSLFIAVPRGTGRSLPACHE